MTMRWVQSGSIQRKLILMAMVTSTGALILACAALASYEVVMFRRVMTRHLRALAHITVENSNVAVAFRDQQDTERILQAFRAEPNIIAAYIFLADGTTLARYPSTAAERVAPVWPWVKDFQFSAEGLEVFAPVIADGEMIGTVFIHSDLVELYDRLGQYLKIMGVVLVVSSGVAFLLSSYLQRVISRPIWALAEAARAVSRGNNYGIRAEKQSEDELGELTDAFNHMLRQIQERDAALEGARDHLEVRVQERTRELEQEVQERKGTAEKLKQLATKLERSNNELQAFAYVASHDLQEPLRKVQAFGDRLRMKCNDALGDEGRDYLERMQNAARRMQNLIDDLLLFSRVSTQGRAFEQIDLNKVVREVLSDLEVRIQQTDGRVELSDLPVIEADPVQMRQLFQNLISNGLKFHKPNEAPVVRLRAEILQTERTGQNGGSYCRLSVADNGIGFDEKYLDRMFAVFQRLHGRNYEGTGIGLAICRKIVERHGGVITAKSAPGQGAAFIVTLPVAH